MTVQAAAASPNTIVKVISVGSHHGIILTVLAVMPLSVIYGFIAELFAVVYKILCAASRSQAAIAGSFLYGFNCVTYASLVLSQQSLPALSPFAMRI